MMGVKLRLHRQMEVWIPHVPVHSAVLHGGYSNDEEVMIEA